MHSAMEDTKFILNALESIAKSLKRLVELKEEELGPEENAETPVDENEGGAPDSGSPATEE